MKELNFYIGSLTKFIEEPENQLHVVRLRARELIEELKNKNYSGLTPIEIHKMFNSLVERWNKANPEDDVFSKSNGTEIKTSFWPFFLRTVAEVYRIEGAAFDDQEKIEQLRRAIKSLNTAKCLLDQFNNNLSNHRYLVDTGDSYNLGLPNIEKILFSQNRPQQIEMNIVEVLENNMLELEEILRGEEFLNEEWKQYARRIDQRI